MRILHIHGTSHVGRSRSRNEDSWEAAPELGVAVVADGMGGHPAGDVASRIAVETVLQQARSDAEERAPSEWLADAVREAQARILGHGRERPERAGMGTTLTALHLDPVQERFTIAHVGDSRGYLFRGGELEPVTRDDTPVQEQVDAGLISREEARVHPMGHVLARALGTGGDVSPRIVQRDLREGDVLLLCTDGVMAVLPDEAIRSAVAPAAGELNGGRDGAARALERAADSLVEEVLERGAPDNVTVVLGRVGGG